MNQFECKTHIGEVLRKKISLYFQDNIAAPLLQIFQTDLFIPFIQFLFSDSPCLSQSSTYLRAVIFIVLVIMRVRNLQKHTIV